MNLEKRNKRKEKGFKRLGVANCGEVEEKKLIEREGYFNKICVDSSQGCV